MPHCGCRSRRTPEVAGSAAIIESQTGLAVAKVSRSRKTGARQAKRFLETPPEGEVDSGSPRDCEE